jgi:hypothetical protein
MPLRDDFLNLDDMGADGPGNPVEAFTLALMTLLAGEVIGDSEELVITVWRRRRMAGDSNRYISQLHRLLVERYDAQSAISIGSALPAGQVPDVDDDADDRR